MTTDTNKFSFLSIVYYSFVIVGFILAIISTFIGSSAGVIVSITAYSCLIAGMIIIIGSLLSSLNETIQKNKPTFFEILKLLKINIGPFLIICGILAEILYLTIYYKNKIESGHVSDNYGIFSNISVILICIQLYILYIAMNKPSYINTKILPLMFSSLIYLIGVINIVIVFTMATILKYYSTDG